MKNAIIKVCVLIILKVYMSFQFIEKKNITNHAGVFR